MTLLPGLLGLAGQLGSAALQAPPSNAVRSSSDYAPFTTVNAVGQVDLKDIAALLHSINEDNAYIGGLHGNLTPTDPLSSPFGGNSNTRLLIIGGIAIVGLLAWRKFKR